MFQCPIHDRKSTVNEVYTEKHHTEIVENKTVNIMGLSHKGINVVLYVDANTREALSETVKTGIDDM